MKIIILGAGEIGFHLAEQLADFGHTICVLEADPELANSLQERLDARILTANGATVTTLGEAGAAEADLFFGLTSDDHTNLVAASLAKSLGTARCIARVHLELQQEEWLFDYRSHFGIDHLFSAERLTAVDLARYIRNPDALLVEEIGRGRIELQQTTLEAGAKAEGCTLKNLGLPPRVRIGWLKRGSVEIVPGASEVLLAGDLLTLFGETRALETELSLFRKGTGRNAVRSVVIFGGSGHGFALAQMLESDLHRTRILENDPVICRELSHMLQKASIIRADATQIEALREEQVGEADFFVAASRDDEDNVMACLQARHLGAKHCVTLIRRADYAEAISRAGVQLGILGAVSPRVSVSRELMRFVTSDRFHTLLRLGGNAEVIECPIGSGSGVAGRLVSEIAWPESTGLVALLRGNQALVPSAEDQIKAGDTLIAIVGTSTRSAFLRLIA